MMAWLKGGQGWIRAVLTAWVIVLLLLWVSGVVQLSSSAAHVLALTGDGRVLSWGSNHHGEIGRAHV